MIFVKKGESLMQTLDIWDIPELQLEKLIISDISDDNKVINENIFGEELLFLKKEVRTNSKKRADILALDRNGSAVIIELKKDRGSLGVETQALQYLADFSNYKGADFIKKFCENVNEDEITSFLDDDISIENINASSRIILVARYFDPTLFSMGKWLAENGVSFRCVSYTPIKIQNKEYIDFSVVFDQLTGKSIYKVKFKNMSREPKIFWHVIEHFKESQITDKEWWGYLVKNNQITTNFDNKKGDRGEEILGKYIKEDKIFAYKSGAGLIGYGIITGKEQILIKRGSTEDVMGGYHLHRLQCKWQYVITDFNKAINSQQLKSKYNIHHPIMTSSEIKSGDIDSLIEHIQKISKNG